MENVNKTCVRRNGAYCPIENLDRLMIGETVYSCTFLKAIQYANRLVCGGPEVLTPIEVTTATVSRVQAEQHKRGFSTLVQPYAASAERPPLPEVTPARHGMFGDRKGWAKAAEPGAAMLSRMGGEYRGVGMTAALEKAQAATSLRAFTAAISDAFIALMQMPENHFVQNAVGIYLGGCLQVLLSDLQRAGVAFVTVDEKGITLWERN